MRIENPTKIVLIFLVCLFLFLSIYVKFLGAYVETPVEKQGYCKIKYGNDFRLYQDLNQCYSYKDGEKITFQFTEQEFLDSCPKPKIISTNIWGNCFHANKGDYIS